MKQLRKWLRQISMILSFTKGVAYASKEIDITDKLIKVLGKTK